MNPQNPYQPQQPPAQPQGPGALPPLYQQPQQPVMQQPQPAMPAQPAPQQWTSQPQAAPPQPYPQQPTQPAVDYMGNMSEQQRQEYSIDYLNKIAPKEQKTVNKFAIFGIIGAIIISAVVAIILLMNAQGPSPDAQIVPIAQRLESLQTITAAQQKHLNERQISEANAALASSLATMNTDLQTIMKARKLNDNNKSAKATEKTYADNLSKTLDDAYQRGALDRTYTTQMTYHLTLLKTKITRLKKASSSKDLDTFADNALTNIDLILKTYASFNATKS